MVNSTLSTVSVTVVVVVVGIGGGIFSTINGCSLDGILLAVAASSLASPTNTGNLVESVARIAVVAVPEPVLLLSRTPVDKLIISKLVLLELECLLWSGISPFGSTVVSSPDSGGF